MTPSPIRTPSAISRSSATSRTFFPICTLGWIVARTALTPSKPIASPCPCAASVAHGSIGCPRQVAPHVLPSAKVTGGDVEFDPRSVSPVSAEFQPCRTSSRSIKARPARAPSSSITTAPSSPSAQKEFTQIFPQPGWVEHDPQEIWATQIARRGRGARPRAGCGRATSPPSASPTSARRPSSGIARPGDPIHNAIVWQDRRTADFCERLKREGHEDAHPRAHRPGHRRLLLRQQDRVDSRQRPGRAGQGRGRRAGVRHHRHLAGLEADRRRDARHRRQQRVAHDAVQHPHARVGRRAADAVRRAGQPAAGGAAVERGLRASVDDARRRRRPDRGHRRRSAGGALRPDVRRAGHGEEHLRHRLLPAAEHRRTAGARRATGCSRPSPGRSAARPTYALEGSVFIGGAVVQWLRDGLGLIRTSADVEALAAIGAGQRRRLPRAGVRRPRRAALGSVRARHDRRHHARHDGRPHRARRAREHRLSGRRPARRDAARRRHRPAGAARRRRRGRQRPAACSSRPTCSACRSCGREVTETTALGAAYLAGLAVGFWDSRRDARAHWRVDRRFEPAMPPAEAAARRARVERGRSSRAKNWIAAKRLACAAHDMLARLAASARGPWDIVVIGGGATGVGIAVDAASRGYDVAAARAARLRQGHVEPQHQARARRRALPRAGQHLARDGGAQGARACCGRTRRTWSATWRSSCPTTTGGRRRSTASA